jgi:hypothetical protein
MLKMPSVVLLPGRNPFCISWSSYSEITVNRAFKILAMTHALFYRPRSRFSLV